MIDFKALSSPFDPHAVSWRVGVTSKDKARGMALAYIDARVVMDRLDEVCGPNGWQCKYSHAGGMTVCDIGINCGLPSDGGWVWKADGAGRSDIEAEKGALSDAFKRAAVRWGIGRYLYDLDSPWVELDQFKQIKKEEYVKLNRILSTKSRDLGWTGPTTDWAGDAVADGSATDTRSTYEITAEKNAKTWCHTAKEALKFAQSERELDDWLEDHTKKLDRLEAKYKPLHDELMKAVADIRKGLDGRVAA